MLDVVPYIVCLFVKLNVYRVQVNLIVEDLGRDSLASDGGRDETDGIVLYLL